LIPLPIGLVPDAGRRRAAFFQEFYDIRPEKILFFKDLVAKFTALPELYRRSLQYPRATAGHPRPEPGSAKIIF
jgi:hypothetical protein